MEAPIVLALNKPHLVGKVLAAGIGMWRLPEGALRLSPSGNLLIVPSFLGRYGNHPLSKLWALIQTDEGATRLVVLQLLKPWQESRIGRLDLHHDLRLLTDEVIERDSDPACYLALLETRLAA